MLLPGICLTIYLPRSWSISKSSQLTMPSHLIRSPLVPGCPNVGPRWPPRSRDMRGNVHKTLQGRLPLLRHKQACLCALISIFLLQPNWVLFQKTRGPRYPKGFLERIGFNPRISEGIPAEVLVPRASKRARLGEPHPMRVLKNRKLRRARNCIQQPTWFPNMKVGSSEDLFLGFRDSPGRDLLFIRYLNPISWF